MDIISIDTLQTTSWSGGITHQIAIYPSDAVFAHHDFIYRVSSAEVELDESNFTSFKKYTRYIISLNNPLKISHNKGGHIELDPLQVHRFSGDVETTAYGKCSDFNLIIQNGLLGSIGVLRHDLQEIPSGHTIIYAYDERVYLEVNGESRIIEKHKALFIRSKEPIKVGFLSSRAVYANIQID